MKGTQEGEHFAQIGASVLAGVENQSGRFYIYAELQPGVVDWSVYEVLDNELVWIEEDPPEGVPDVSDPIQGAWYVEPKNKRWAAMEYWIDNGRFTVQLHYPGEIDLEDDDRREKMLEKRFPGKTVRYPEEDDWLEEWMKLNPDRVNSLPREELD